MVAHMRHMRQEWLMEKDSPFPVKKLAGFTRAMAGRIRKYRLDKKLLSDNEAIRTLIEIGLQTQEKGSQK